MKKALSIILGITLTLGMNLCCISCNNNEENKDTEIDSPPYVFNTIKYGDYIKSIENVSGVIKLSPINVTYYIEDSESNRYWFHWEQNHWNNFRRFLFDGYKVQIEGKLYAFDEEYMEELKKEYNFDYEMPAHAKQYVLVSPDFSLTVIE